MSNLGTYSIDHSVESNMTVHRRFTFENTSIASKFIRTISRLVLFIRVVTHDLSLCFFHPGCHPRLVAISLLFCSSGLSPTTCEQRCTSIIKYATTPSWRQASMPSIDLAGIDSINNKNHTPVHGSNFVFCVQMQARAIFFFMRCLFDSVGPQQS